MSRWGGWSRSVFANRIHPADQSRPGWQRWPFADGHSETTCRRRSDSLPVPGQHRAERRHAQTEDKTGDEHRHEQLQQGKTSTVHCCCEPPCHGAEYPGTPPGAASPVFRRFVGKCRAARSGKDEENGIEVPFTDAGRARSVVGVFHEASADAILRARDCVSESMPD